MKNLVAERPVNIIKKFTKIFKRIRIENADMSNIKWY